MELAWPRRMMRDLLAGIGDPYLVVRVGWGPDAELPPAPPPRAGRRHRGGGPAAVTRHGPVGRRRDGRRSLDGWRTSTRPTRSWSSATRTPGASPTAWSRRAGAGS
ncbi:hypothetical protein V2I01_41450 [Micromonospora sp. BRA006-A]|nr:hypothetical protein [Micromonospora sp. BRA006-A]